MNGQLPANTNVGLFEPPNSSCLKIKNGNLLAYEAGKWIWFDMTYPNERTRKKFYVKIYELHDWKNKMYFYAFNLLDRA